MQSTLPLQPGQLAAAARIRDRLPQWRLCELALVRLHESVPGFSPESSLLKVVAVNSLYATQVYALVRMAEHVARVMATAPAQTASLDLVERIASLPGDGKRRKFVSFASKFCHFFVDQERFPIYDDAAREALKLHLGKGGYIEDDADRYRAFCKNIDRLHEANGVRVGTRELDRYLWLMGMYQRWLKERRRTGVRVNAELMRLFATPTRDETRDLNDLLPFSLGRPKGSDTLSASEG